MRFENYARPDSLATALEILSKEKNAVIVGGNTFLRFSNKKYSTVIDLSNLHLTTVEETPETIEIGASTTFRDMEINPILINHFKNLIPKSVQQVVGVQFRNAATIGGAICGHYGFSEIITALLVLDCELVFANFGKISLIDYLADSKFKKDILTKIIIKKKKGKTSYQAIRKSDGDFPVLSLAVSNQDGIKISVGARPSLAKPSLKAAELLTKNGITDETIKKAGEIIEEEFTYADDIRASGEYRKSIVAVLLKRALKEVL